MDKKKLLFGGIFVIIIVIIGISYYLTAQTPTVTAPQNTQGLQPSPVSDNGTRTATKSNPHTIQAAVSPTSGMTDTPEAIATSFYDWYINYPKDVVETGAYRTSSYLTPGFITIINGFAANYNPKYDPVFCNANKTKDYSVSKAMSTHNPNKIKVQIMTKNEDNPRPLYDVIIVQENGLLKVDDVMCD